MCIVPQPKGCPEGPTADLRGEWGPSGNWAPNDNGLTNNHPSSRKRPTALFGLVHSPGMHCSTMLYYAGPNRKLALCPFQRSASSCASFAQRRHTLCVCMTEYHDINHEPKHAWCPSSQSHTKDDTTQHGGSAEQQPFAISPPAFF